VLTRSNETNALGLVVCGVCNENHLIATKNDPLRATFRDFTEQERKQIIVTDRSRKAPACPVDGTAMEVNVQRSLGRTSNVVVRCRRCNHSVEFARAHG
jgi:hypothetical protein